LSWNDYKQGKIREKRDGIFQMQTEMRAEQPG